MKFKYARENKRKKEKTNSGTMVNIPTTKITSY